MTPAAVVNTFRFSYSFLLVEIVDCPKNFDEVRAAPRGERGGHAPPPFAACPLPLSFLFISPLFGFYGKIENMD